MEVYNAKESCSGCTACLHSCPQAAISMWEDSEGFMYPSVDDKVCIKCEMCRNICPLKDEHDMYREWNEPEIYAAINKDEMVRLSSSSGGLFVSISDYILEQKGVIYGAAFDDNFRVCHQRADTKDGRDKFKGSKYVQSSLGDIFKEVKRDIENGRYVLFTGTPCQIAGLKAYCDNYKKDKLYLCDIVCHGTPSPQILKEYLGLIEKKYKNTISEFFFRHKGKWRGYNYFVRFADGTSKFNTDILLTYFDIFCSHLALRPSCHNCKFTNFSRPSDITLADFWGIEKCKPHLDDEKGVSLVLINTSKGRELFERIQNGLIHEKSSKQECLQYNLHSPSKPSQRRGEFWRDYYEKGFDYVVANYTNCNLQSRIKNKVISPFLMKIGLHGLIKRMLNKA